jgi:H+/Cl- antiporter ClcA
VTAVVAAVVVALLVGLPTDVIPNPVFGRPVPVTWWSYPTLALTAVLGGLLAATYVREQTPTTTADAPARRGGVAGMLAFFAVGCPVCNKIVVLALGTTGAMRWFPPLQHLLAVASIALMAWALRGRLRSTCPVPAR